MHINFGEVTLKENLEKSEILVQFNKSIVPLYISMPLPEVRKMIHSIGNLSRFKEEELKDWKYSYYSTDQNSREGPTVLLQYIGRVKSVKSDTSPMEYELDPDSNILHMIQVHVRGIAEYYSALSRADIKRFYKKKNEELMNAMVGIFEIEE